MTSQLQIEDWSVTSDRGREASGVSYEEARRLVRRLAAEGRHGLCIITDQAARRIVMASAPVNERQITTAI